MKHLHSLLDLLISGEFSTQMSEDQGILEITSLDRSITVRCKEQTYYDMFDAVAGENPQHFIDILDEETEDDEAEAKAMEALYESSMTMEEMAAINYSPYNK